MPQLLTCDQIDLMRNGTPFDFDSIAEYRSFAMSVRHQDDVDFLRSALDGNDPLVASRALTALYYFGGVVGIGANVRKWLKTPETGTPIDTFGPAIMQDAIINAGDITAVEALFSCEQQLCLSVSVAQSIEAVNAAFPHKSVERQKLFNGELWADGSYLLQQLDSLDRRQLPENRIVWMLKAFPSSPSVKGCLLHYAAVESTGIVALRVLVGFMGYTPSIEILRLQRPADDDDLIKLFNISLELYSRTKASHFVDFVHSLAEADSSGRIARALARMRL